MIWQKGECCIMETTINMLSTDGAEKKLFEELDKGIDDMEKGRITPHEETMSILKQRYEDHVLQNL